MEELQPPNNSGDLVNFNNGEISACHDLITYSDDFDSACSTPYVSAPSSPGRAGGGSTGFFYSAPASPMHFILSTSSSLSSPTPSRPAPASSFEFDFSGRCAADGKASAGSMTSADELFLNGQIRPMKLSSHLQRPQMLAPLIDLDETEAGEDGVGSGNDDGDKVMRGRDLNLRSERSKSLRRRTRSMSPLRSSDAFQWLDYVDNEKEETEGKHKHSLEVKQSEEIAGADSEMPPSGASSRSSSVGRNSKRWVFLKEFLYRSKSEGRSSTSSGHKFWSSLPFTPTKDKKAEKTPSDSTSKSATPGTSTAAEPVKGKERVKEKEVPVVKKAVNGIGGKRRVARSAHELHYAANRAQSEELRRKTYLPYRQGLLGCLGFSSKSYGAMNGFARALNPVSSR